MKDEKEISNLPAKVCQFLIDSLESHDEGVAVGCEVKLWEILVVVVLRQ